MCGILAIFGPDYSKGSDLLSLMKHRGPDNKSDWSKPEVYLGHQRLSILDLNPRSNQPFIRNNLILIYNGEIYNFEELIVQHNLKVETKSDTEVVLAMFEKYGSECVNFFNGMFAFLIYNRKNGDYFVARDRLGIKPLYYFKDKKGNTIFSSEIAPIVEHVKPNLSNFAIRQYKKFRMCVNNDTIYKNIKHFPAAHFTHNLDYVTRYWDIDITPKSPPTIDELRELIISSVNYRKISDVAVGSYLSGGLDSTILTAILKPNHTWTIGFEDLNEFNWATLAAKKYKTEHHEMVVDLDIFYETMDWMVKKRMEPLSVPNEVLIYIMTKSVKEKNTVILSGEGADELFFGYDRIFRWANASKTLDYDNFDKKYCYGKHEDNEIIDYALSGIKGNTVLEKINYYFLTNHIQGLLRRVDNSTMLCSVEARVPFLDHRLVNRIAGCPFEWKMGETFKSPLKEAFSDMVPKEILSRPKMGFPVPIDYDIWLKANLGVLF